MEFGEYGLIGSHDPLLERKILIHFRFLKVS